LDFHQTGTVIGENGEMKVQRTRHLEVIADRRKSRSRTKQNYQKYAELYLFLDNWLNTKCNHSRIYFRPDLDDLDTEISALFGNLSEHLRVTMLKLHKGKVKQ
jgi:hypothetical protein